MKATILRGLESIAVLFGAVMLVALVANALVGIPVWLLVAPLVCWAVFTSLYLTIAAYAILRLR